MCCKNTSPMRDQNSKPMNPASVLALIVVLLLMVACAGAREVLIATATPDIEGTVQAAAAATIPTPTPTPPPDLDATVAAGIAATLAAIPTPTPTPTSTPVPTDTPTPTPTPTPIPTPRPTFTPTPRPTPTPTLTPTPRPTLTPTPTPTSTPRPTSTPTPRPTATSTPTPAPKPVVLRDIYQQYTASNGVVVSLNRLEIRENGNVTYIEFDYTEFNSTPNLRPTLQWTLYQDGKRGAEWPEFVWGPNEHGWIGKIQNTGGWKLDPYQSRNGSFTFRFQTFPPNIQLFLAYPREGDVNRSDLPDEAFYWKVK